MQVICDGIAKKAKYIDMTKTLHFPMDVLDSPFGDR